ncbi:STAS domain-containing protein [Streptomyces sp. NPDC088097]|uniref:STAS domain-containing protein n=1 Tax=Streptomyces sp. NPDC088097 TaxID=3365823 RepID=UPI003821293F
MTPPPDFASAHLRLISAQRAEEGLLHLEVHGFLDFDSAEHFLAAATEHLAATPGLRTLRLDCGGLNGIDSMGLAMLLMLHRRTTAVHVMLCLEARPPALERMLTLTGAMDHLVPGRPIETDGHTETHRMAYRHTSEDGIPVEQAGHGPRPAGPGTST